MTRLIFIRHGQSVANYEDKFAGHSDFDLTDLGRKQAELAADYVKKNFKIDAIYASDLLRAYNTAVPSAKAFGLEITPSKELREIYAGVWEAMTFSDIIRDYAKDFAVWRDDFGHSYCPEGETVVQLSKRVCAEVRRIAEENDGKTVLIATHATPIRAIQCDAAGYSAEEMRKVNFVGNASISVFDCENGRFIAKEVGICDHLGDLSTYLPKSLE